MKTEEIINGILRSQLGNVEVRPENTLKELGADSLDEINIVMAIEDKFDIHIPTQDIGFINNVQKLYDYVQANKPL